MTINAHLVASRNGVNKAPATEQFLEVVDLWLIKRTERSSSTHGSSGGFGASLRETRSKMNCSERVRVTGRASSAILHPRGGAYGGFEAQDTNLICRTCLAGARLLQSQYC
jgi:hypothetical protein